MMQDRFEQLLKQAMGLDAHSIGTTAVMRAVESRARTCGFADLQQYWERINSDAEEMQALIEAVVVPETWFYRDREAFAAAASLLRTQWQSGAARLPLRLLSLPCSTGEEPFTLAMALLDAGLPPASFRIDGIDISHRALQRARASTYGRNSFRGTDLSYRDRHFEEAAQGYRLSDAVQAPVHFAQGNIFGLNHLADGSFDVIFCRNLLIYFDAGDQRRAAGVLRRLLAPAGTLFVGHSEASVVLGEGFASLRIPHAFAFSKQAAAKDATGSRRPNVPRPPKPKPPAPVVAPRLPFTAARSEAPARSTPRPVPVPRPGTLDDIRRAADRGELDLALQLGRAVLDQGRPTAEALHLLAVINEAAGNNNAAADLYRKTLYLDPAHHEALTHLTLLLRRMGDSAGAQRMDERARRLTQRRGA